MAAKIEDLETEQRTELAKLYFAAAQEAAKEYDQRIFWLVTGASAIFGYLQSQLPPQAEWRFMCLLFLGWLSLFVALAAIMFSFLRASTTHHLWAKYWLWDDESCGDDAAKRGRSIRFANWTAFIAVFGGIALLGAFLAINFFIGG